jgi:glycosyltransferase involved in cell wall biosynthesis
LGPPLIIGPIGGGETSPFPLRDGLGFRGKVLESLRDLSNATININPILRTGLKRAAVVFTKTSDTRNLLSEAQRDKSVVFIEVSVPETQIGHPRAMRQGSPRLLYAGRLLYWKGVHIAIRAFAQVLSKLPSARLTIVGRGPEEARLRADVIAHDISQNVDFISWLPQRELTCLYNNHDLLLFPSLHDSSGWVVLEALCQGLPVVCLDVGGPKDIVTLKSGVIIKTDGLNTNQVAANIAVQLYELLSSPTTLSALSAGAISRANEFLLPNRIGKFYKQALNYLDRANLPLTSGRTSPTLRYRDVAAAQRCAHTSDETKALSSNGLSKRVTRVSEKSGGES